MLRPALIASLGLMVLGACSPQPEPEAVTPRIGMPNPASVHCTQQGGRLEIRTNKDGGQFGVCLFSDGRQCEEWALLRDKRCVAPS
jgi:putative hemolysin